MLAHLSDVENYFLKIGFNTFIMMFIQNQRTIELFEKEELMLNTSVSLENHFFYIPINVYHSFACFNLTQNVNSRDYRKEQTKKK